MKKETISLGELFTSLTSPPDPWYGEHCHAQDEVEHLILDYIRGVEDLFDLEELFPPLWDHTPELQLRQYVEPQKMIIAMWYELYLRKKETTITTVLKEKTNGKFSWNDIKRRQINIGILSDILSEHKQPLPISIFGEVKGNSKSFYNKRVKESIEIDAEHDKLYHIDKLISKYTETKTYNFDDEHKKNEILKSLYVQKFAIEGYPNFYISILDQVNELCYTTESEIIAILQNNNFPRRTISRIMHSMGKRDEEIGRTLINKLKDEADTSEANKKRGARLRADRKK